MKWYRMYVNSIRDIKFRKLKKQDPDNFPHVWTLWCLLLDEAAQSGGVIRYEDDDELDVMFDVISDTISISGLLNRLDQVGLITVSDKEIVVINWEKYQSSEYSTPRVRKHRENKEREAAIDEVILFLNKTIDKRYSLKTDGTRKNINARFEEGRTLDDFKTVILSKTAEWKGTKMEQFLRPQTLFIPQNFENYLNSAPAKFTRGGDLIHCRDMYGEEHWITEEQFNKAESGFFRRI